jgi:hypothetical protein
MEENLDQQEATDLTSTRRDSLHVLDNSSSHNYQSSKAPRMENTSVARERPQKHSSQAKQQTLNIRNDLKKQSTSLDSTNLMSSRHKGLESYRGDNTHQVDNKPFPLFQFLFLQAKFEVTSLYKIC